MSMRHVTCDRVTNLHTSFTACTHTTSSNFMSNMPHIHVSHGTHELEPRHMWHMCSCVPWLTCEPRQVWTPDVAHMWVMAHMSVAYDFMSHMPHIHVSHGTHEREPRQVWTSNEPAHALHTFVVVQDITQRTHIWVTHCTWVTNWIWVTDCAAVTNQHMRFTHLWSCRTSFNVHTYESRIVYASRTEYESRIV